MDNAYLSNGPRAPPRCRQGPMLSSTFPSPPPPPRSHRVSVRLPFFFSRSRGLHTQAVRKPPPPPPAKGSERSHTFQMLSQPRPKSLFNSFFPPPSPLFFRAILLTSNSQGYGAGASHSSPTLPAFHLCLIFRRKFFLPVPV